MIWIFATLLIVIPSALSCGEEVELSRGDYVIESPNYPDEYPALTSCEWKITTTSSAGFILDCPSIDIRSSYKCLWNYITISAGSEELSFCDKTSFSAHIDANSFDFNFFSFLFYNGRYKGFSCKVSLNEEEEEEEEEEEDGVVVEKPETCACGIKNPSRIVGGEEADLHEYPWQVMLRSGSGSHYCGGTLISENYVLTASHCVEDDTTDTMFVSLGEHQKYTSSETDKTKHVRVSEIIRHENYDSDIVDNDIALLRLAKPIEFNTAILPVCLPFGLESTSISGETGTVTGWGKVVDGGSTSGTLLEVDLPLLTTSECRKYYPYDLTDNMICTYKYGKDSCQGDSGGPLTWNKNGKNYLIGVVSWGIGCAKYNYPGVYAKVTNYLNWIEDKTGETFCKL